jgi:hypothetical protein
MDAQRFIVTAQDGGRGRLFIPVPFDPDQVWRPKPRHHVGGTVNGHRMRGVIESHDHGVGIMMGPTWMRDCGGLAPGDRLHVEVVPEGPQQDDLAGDIKDAIAANPDAERFYNALAQFYRKAYLRYIDATKRHPEQRPERIAEVVALLAAGVKERPK